MVVGHQGVKLQGVELEAGVMDVLHVLHGVFVHGQEGGGLETQERTVYRLPFTARCPRRVPPSHLYDSTEVAVGSQLQTLFLSPGLDVAELLSEDGPPVVTAQPRLCVRHQLVEQPHVDEVEELREELDGQRGVDPTPPQQRHGSRQGVQDVLWTRRKGGNQELLSRPGSGLQRRV